MNELRVTAVRIDCERIGINNAGGSDLRYLRMSYKASRVFEYLCMNDSICNGILEHL